MKIDLSVVIPLYNEEKSVKRIAALILKELEDAKISYELILVNNGSKDSTLKIVASLARDNPSVKTVHIKVNKGYGFGIISGLNTAKGDVVGWTDGDEQVKPEDLLKLYAFLVKNDCDVVKGKRFVREDGFSRTAASLFYNALVNMLFFTWINDVNAKPKLFKRKVYKSLKLKSKDWFIDTELLVKSVKLGYNICDVGVVFVKRRCGKSNVRLITVSEFLRNLFNFRWFLWKTNLK